MRQVLVWTVVVPVTEADIQYERTDNAKQHIRDEIAVNVHNMLRQVDLVSRFRQGVCNCLLPIYIG